MNRRELFAVLGSPAAAALAGGAGSGFPPRKEILALMQKVNRWQREHPVVPPGDRNWTRATWYTGVMAAWKATRDPSFLKQAADWGTQHGWQVGTEPGGANRLFCVETWVELYFVRKDRARIEPAIAWLASSAPNTPAGSRNWHYERLDHSYVDALYGASALAMLAKATGDSGYLATMHAFFDDVTAELFDREAGLYYRDKRFLGKKTANGKKILWSRGNGWAFAGIARILEYLPRNDSKRPRYVEIFRTMAKALSGRQGADGLWRVNLDDPAEFPDPETSGTGFFCFGLGWGVRNGVLPRADYLPAVRRAWAGLARSVTPEGKVEWGQQIDSQPNQAGRSSSHEYVAGTLLLAGSEAWRLSGSRG